MTDPIAFKRPERDTAQREAKRLAILRSAAKIFNERGFHRTSVADVAEALGVSKPFLYYYLQNKEDILFECSRIATEELHAVLDEVRKADLPGWPKLEMLFRGYAKVMTTDFGICLIRNSVPGALPRESWDKLRGGRRRLKGRRARRSPHRSRRTGRSCRSRASRTPRDRGTRCADRACRPCRGSNRR